MTLKLTNCAVILAAVSMMSSCLKSENDVITYDDAVISSFTLGTLTCDRTLKSSKGEDSTYTYTYTGSGYRMNIDQLNNTISNSTMLLYGTRMNKVLATIRARNNGIILLKEILGDNYTYYNSTDSIDFSIERQLRVVSSDGQHKRDYKVKIAVQPEYPDSFTWDALEVDNAEIANSTEMKSAVAGKYVYVLSKSDVGVTLQQSEDGASWTGMNLTATPLAQNASVGSMGETLYVLSDGKLYSTDGATTLAEVSASGDAPKTLIGGCNGELYGMSAAGTFMVMRDGVWSADDVFAGEGDIVADHDINLVSLTSNVNAGVSQVTVVANAKDADAKTAVVWNKIVDKDAPQPWAFTPFSPFNSTYLLDNMRCLSAMAYNNMIVAIGGATPTVTANAYKKMYYSRDHGLTWHTSELMLMPEALSGAEVIHAQIVAFPEQSTYSGYFLVIASVKTDGGNKTVVYRAKQNSVTWSDDQKYFN